MALIPPFFLDCVVAIGIDDAEGKRHWFASGFLYGHFLRWVDEKEKIGRYRVYLVTNRHVFEGRKIVYVRFNPKEAIPAREYSIDLEEKAGEYQTHPDADIDLAVLRINPNILVEQGIQFSHFFSNTNVADKKTIEDLGLTEGDFGYILGFPMGIVGEQRSFVIARHATIARIRDYLAGASKEILMDCMIFPGNSGGPVVTKPEAMAIQDTKSQGAAYLLGVVSDSISYTDVAVSQQTKRVRIVFEDNSGLASIVPVQYLADMIKDLQPSPETQPAEISKSEEAEEAKEGEDIEVKRVEAQ